jgi:hypothetical protein
MTDYTQPVSADSSKAQPVGLWGYALPNAQGDYTLAYPSRPGASWPKGAVELCFASYPDPVRDACIRLRAEVGAKDAANAALRDCLRECSDDLAAEISARASGELPRRIERDLSPVRRARELLDQPVARKGAEGVKGEGAEGA